MNSFEDSVLRVLNGDLVVGAAFLVSDRLVATCAHVVAAAGAKVGGKLSLRSSDMRVIEATVEPEFWRDQNAEDIAILRLNKSLENIQPVILGSSPGTKGHTFSSFGFPKHGQELSGSGEIIGQAAADGMKYLQLDSRQVTPGFSGAPIFDETTKRVVGMVVAITPPDEYQRLGTTAFAIPSETIREICSELQISDICPYRSLDVFNEEDAPFFFGRERVVQKIIDSLKREPRFLAVLGPSGSGKSSVVRAGLIPALRQGKVPGSDKWDMMIIRPASQPFEQLDGAGLSRSQEGLEKAVRTWLEEHPQKTRLVLMIDQFEEVLVSTPEQIRQQFSKEIEKILDSSAAITLVLTLRDDFYSRFLQDAATLAAWLERGLVNIPTTIEEDELRAMVLEPADKIGFSFEEGLVEIIVRDAIEADLTKEKARSTILPLLEFALTQLWERQQDGRLTHGAYTSIDGVTGGLAQWADQAYNTLNRDDQFLARRTLTDLIFLGDPAQGLPDSKRRRTISDLCRVSDEYEDIYRVVRVLADRRLLVTGRDEEYETVELIHDALLREWGQLRSWLQSDRDFRIWQEQLSMSIKRWSASNKDEGALLRGAPLIEAEGWHAKRSSDLKDSEQEYINLSILLREREQSEQARRHAAEALAKSSRMLSSLMAAGEVPQQIVSQLSQVVKSDRCAIFLEDVNGVPRLHAHIGFAEGARMEELNYSVKGVNVYHSIAKQTEPMVIGDTLNMQGWGQPAWHPADGSWLGVPLYSKNRVTGMLTLTRMMPGAFNQDEVLLASTFAIQASIALENARLYDDLNRFNQMMERMIEQRVDELSSAYQTLEKLDKNKSDFIQIAAHELRTPLVVVKGYMGMIKSAPAVQENPALVSAMDGVIQGTDRLHQIVNSMLDLARLENEVLTPRLEALPLGSLLRLIKKDYADDLMVRQIRLDLDPSLNILPPLLADPELLKKALENVIINAIKFTPDGGSIFISAKQVEVRESRDFCEIRIRDTGIGIDSSNLGVIFEKLYQIGKVELHSSGRTKFKGGGPGLGLAIAAGIVKAHNGKIWAESPGYDEEKLPGSTFVIQIPIAE